MKKVTKEKKVSKKVDYKMMYEELNDVIENLKDELDYETDLRVERASIINDLEEKLGDAEYKSVVWSCAALLVGVAIGLLF